MHDEREFELRTVVEEREALTKHSGFDLGEPFDVSAPPAELVATMLRRLALQAETDKGRAPIPDAASRRGDAV